MRIFAVSNNERPFIADCTIEEAKENRDAINRYNEVIEKYFDKPLTFDSEVEIINY